MYRTTLGVMRAHIHGNRPAFFEGRASRFYDFVARRPLRDLYRRIADDLVVAILEVPRCSMSEPAPGVLLVELAERRPDLRLTGIDLSADMVAAARTPTWPRSASARRLGWVTSPTCRSVTTRSTSW